MNQNSTIEIIMDCGQTCPIDVTEDLKYERQNLLHITCNAKPDILEDLHNEFGKCSQNFGKKFKFIADGFFKKCTTGSGEFPVNRYMEPYFLDKERSIYGGLCIESSEIAAVTKYIQKKYPQANITDRLERLGVKP